MKYRSLAVWVWVNGDEMEKKYQLLSGTKKLRKLRFWVGSRIQKVMGLEKQRKYSSSRVEFFFSRLAELLLNWLCLPRIRVTDTR